MKREITILTAVLVILFFLLSTGYADIPVRQEQLIYTITVFNGMDYTITFCHQGSDTIYLLANVENFITARKSLVYFWPLTQEWKVDIDNLNRKFNGLLELKGRNIESQQLKETKYTLQNSKGEYDFNWKVYKEEEADMIRKQYEEAVTHYRELARKYNIEKRVYEERVNDLSIEIIKARNDGEDPDELIKVLNNIHEPEEPPTPDYYVRPVEEAFILKLPVGRYSMRFFNKDGTIMEGSEKKLVVFDKRREKEIGFEIIPSDRWTRPTMSMTPASIIYIDGSAELYLQPFFQDEFSDLFYNKMVNNDSKGNPNIMKWIRMRQVPGSRLELIEKNGQKRTIFEDAFFVDQGESSSIGYSIVPYEPEGAHEGLAPSLRAFHILYKKNVKSVKIKLENKDGVYFDGSEREIRIIDKSKKNIISILLTFLPLISMFYVLIKRSKKYTLE
jgi:hypothetical protein